MLSSIEVKDKDFTKEDVEHAIHKFASSKIEKSLFIFGRKVNFDRDNVFETAAELGLLDQLKKSGWKSLSASETGRLGGIMNRKIRKQKESQENTKGS